MIKIKKLQFWNEVSVLTSEGDVIKSDFAEYNKDNGILILKNNISLTDKYNNILTTNHIEYREKQKIFSTKGPTKIITSEKYFLEGRDLTANKKENLIFSENETYIVDKENNKIFLSNFKYNTIQNFFKSIGNIKVEDKNNNLYKFSQVYIDTKKGDCRNCIKAYLNQDEFKIKEENNPRVFANSVSLTKEKEVWKNTALCSYEKKINVLLGLFSQQNAITMKKQYTTIMFVKNLRYSYFYFPKLSHPDPSMDRR